MLYLALFIMFSLLCSLLVVAACMRSSQFSKAEVSSWACSATLRPSAPKTNNASSTGKDEKSRTLRRRESPAF